MSECTNATLVNVKASFLSYASIIKKYRERGIKKIAILGFSDQFKHNMERLNNTWDENVTFFVYNWRKYTDQSLHRLFRQELIRLREEGFEAFIGNNSIIRIVLELGLVCEENSPDTDLVEAALEEAKQIAESILSREEKKQTISAFLEAVPEILLKIDRSGLILDYNTASEKAFDANKLNNIITRLFPNCAYIGKDFAILAVHRIVWFLLSGFGHICS